VSANPVLTAALGIVLRAFLGATAVLLVLRGGLELGVEGRQRQALPLGVESIERLPQGQGPIWVEVKDGVLLFDAAVFEAALPASSRTSASGERSMLVPVVTDLQRQQWEQGHVVTVKLLARLPLPKSRNGDARGRSAHAPAAGVKGVLLAGSEEDPRNDRFGLEAQRLRAPAGLRLLLSERRPWHPGMAVSGLLGGLLLGLAAIGLGAGRRER
jgi:hypothetical protein